MSLSDDIRGFRESWQPQQGPSCKVRLLIDAMDEADVPAFEDLLGSTIFGTDIAKMCNGWGDREDLSESFRVLAASIRSDAVQRHRRGACACAKVGA